MKRIITLPTLVSILLIGFISCNKKNNDSNNSNPVVNSNYLSRIVFVSNSGSGDDVLQGSTTYIFDNLKRVTQILDSSTLNGSGPLQLWETKSYYYNGNDSLPYKLIVIGNPATQVEYDTTTDFYTYNSAGLLIRDTGYYVSHGVTSSDHSVSSNQTYGFSGTIITGRRDDIVTYNGSSHPEIRIDTAHTDANGNIAQNIKHKDFGTVTSTITWDNHPSPFAKLNTFHSTFIFPFGETFFYEMPGYNNRLHITEVTNDGTVFTYDEDYTGRYTYNSDGYPTQILNPDASTAGAYDKITFEYKPL